MRRKRNGELCGGRAAYLSYSEAILFDFTGP